MRKLLPDNEYEQEKIRSQDYFTRAIDVLEIDETVCNIHILAQLMDTLTFTATNRNNYYADGVPGALKVLIDAIAGYAVGETEQ